MKIIHLLFMRALLLVTFLITYLYFSFGQNLSITSPSSETPHGTI